MNPGLLRDRISFDCPVKISTGTTSKDGWEIKYPNIPANVFHSAGRKAVDADEIVTDYTLRFTVRYHLKSVITSDMVIIYNKLRYKILDINPQFAQNNVVITAEVVQGGNKQ